MDENQESRDDVSEVSDRHKLRKTDRDWEKQKIAKSCDHCKLKKIKCDQRKPKCDNCHRYEKECVYSKMKKPGIKAGYGKHVLERLNELEYEIREDRLESEKKIEHMKLCLKLLENRLSSFESGKHMQHANENMSTSFAEDAIPKETSPIHGNRCILNLENDLPDIVTVKHLIHVYFEKCHPLFPILHPETTKMQLLNNVSISNKVLLGVLVNSLKFSDNALNTEESEHYFKLFKSRIIQECLGVTNLQQLQAMSLLTFALYGESSYAELWSLMSVITSGCVHLEITKEISSRSGASPLALNNEKDEKSSSGLVSSNVPEWNEWVRKETQRNLLWEIYVLDKISSAATSFSSKLFEEEINCLLPVKIEIWEEGRHYGIQNPTCNQSRVLAQNGLLQGENEQLYDSTCYIIEIVHILGDIQRFMKDLIDIRDMKGIFKWQISLSDLESKINSWRDTLPRQYVEFLENKEFDLHDKPLIKDILFHSLYHITIIRLNSAAAFPYIQEKYFLSSSSARSKCMMSVELIVDLSKRLTSIFPSCGQLIFELLGPYYAFALWVSGRVVLVNSLHTNGRLSEDFNYLIILLKRIGIRFKCASKYADILEFFRSDEHESKYTNSENEEESAAFETGSSYAEDTRIISDMRLHACSLDALLSKKIAKYKNTKGIQENRNDLFNLSIFDWFKYPVNDGVISSYIES